MRPRARRLLAAALPAATAALLAAGAAGQVGPGGQAPAPYPGPALAPTSSQLRIAIEQPGRLVVTRLRSYPAIALADGAKLVVSGVGAFEPGHEEERLLGLAVDVEHARLSEDDARSYLDLHEVESLLQAMGTLEEVSRAPSPLDTEADFATTEAFTVGLHIHGGKVSWFVRSGREAPRELALSGASFQALREGLLRARQDLFQ